MLRYWPSATGAVPFHEGAPRNMLLDEPAQLGQVARGVAEIREFPIEDRRNPALFEETIVEADIAVDERHVRVAAGEVRRQPLEGRCHRRRRIDVRIAIVIPPA